nr:hypothetical protein [Rubrobacter sp.]
MSERERTEGNTDASKVDAQSNGDSGPRRVEEVREEREVGHDPESSATSSDTGQNADPDDERYRAKG